MTSEIKYSRGKCLQSTAVKFHPELRPSFFLSLGSLSNDVFERRTSTGSGPFSFLDDGFAQIFSQIVSIRVKKLSNTNYIASRHITREKSSLPVDVRCSKTSLLKLPINPPYKVRNGTICNRRLFAPPYSNFFLRRLLNSFRMMMKLKTD